MRKLCAFDVLDGPGGIGYQEPMMDTHSLPLQSGFCSGQTGCFQLSGVVRSIPVSSFPCMPDVLSGYIFSPSSFLIVSGFT